MRSLPLRFSLLLGLIFIPHFAAAQTPPANAQTPPAKPSSAPTIQSSGRISKIQGTSTKISETFVPVGPDYHIVRSGDTLWDLSGSYLNNHFMWPVLWSYNPQITNPHWIYPGDTIFLSKQSSLKPELAKDEMPAKQNAKVLRSVQSSIVTPVIFLENLPDNIGHILFSEEEKLMLSVNDEVQVDWKDESLSKTMVPGQIFAIYSQQQSPLDQDDDEIGVKLVRAGTLEIIPSRQPRLRSARITQAFREIKRGDIILPQSETAVPLRSLASQVNLEGKIIDTVDPISQIGQYQIVAINRGSDHGVKNGNRWLVFEQREGQGRLEKGEGTRTAYVNNDSDRDRNDDITRLDERGWPFGEESSAPVFPENNDIPDYYKDRDYTTDDLPLKKIGEIMVVGTNNKFCTAIVTQSTREFDVNTRVVLVKGF